MFMQKESQRHNDKGRAKTSLEKYVPLTLFVTFACERGLVTEQNCNILTPTFMAISVVSFLFSRAAQPEAQRPTRQAFFTASYHQLVWSPNSSDFLSSPSYIIVQYPTQSPTQSLECHVWSSSSGNNCHAVQRPLSSGASVYECIMGLYLVPFRRPNPPTRFLSVTGHWNVSLPSGASLYNGMFGRVEGQYTT